MVCELDTCPRGEESVLVGAAALVEATGRVLLETTPLQSQSASWGRWDPNQAVPREQGLQHHAVRDGGGALLRGRSQDRPRQPGDEDGVSGRGVWQRRESGRRRRRLASLQDVEFLVPSEGGTEGEDGEVMTESQQAAAFVNNMADSVSEGRVARPLVWCSRLFSALLRLFSRRFFLSLERRDR